ncbi:MBOAT family protein [Loa loa]|uniref:Protein-serine O-palmitoleoyltransferase porcupine n=1 Tax=Loa loa TaxID=7209 RepID=A0A1I7V7C4_LOALO|nr:MBOAT family protein [Loa loa]EFO20748.2 MBOAT family protein [Loa loa]
MIVSTMFDEERWFYDEALELSDEEIPDSMHIKENTTHQWLRCSIGVLDSLHVTIVKLLLFSALKRFIVFLHAKGIVSEFALHLTFVVSGLFIIGTQNNFFSSICAYVALIVVLPYYKFLFNKQTKFIMLAYSVGMLLVWQYFFTAKEFMSMRGILMILVMKITSLSFDLANEFRSSITLLHLLSYMFDSSTVLFGPWITYKQYQDSLYLKEFKVEIINFFRALSYIALSLLAVIYSSCIADNFVELPFIGAYFVAQSFRFSHYFISWFSAGTSLLSGIDSGVVTDWIHIELPRSLVDVVVSWNIPMHRFLHQYIFGEIKKYGSATAVFITYAVSSLFHGINFQLSAVLLSLGLYTYAETEIRSKLSRRIDSCIRARKCRKECHHTWKESALSTLAINMVFRALALTHLVYLGMAFDDSTAETGYSWRHTLSIWADSYYFSHVIGLFTLLLSLAF